MSSVEEDKYFQSYLDLNVHRTMLSDTQRLNAYKTAIFANTEFWKDKVVLDVGAGTGILSIYCAQAGAAKVYSVEANEELCSIMYDIVQENNVGHIVEPVSGCIEKVCLKCGRVDVIVSEWMGHYLFHESMLSSVIFARDRYLKEDGLMFPNLCRLYASPCSLPDYYERWDDVTGVAMKSFSSALRAFGRNLAEITTLPTDLLLTDRYDEPIYQFSMHDISAGDLECIDMQAIVTPQRDGKLQGVCVWFDVSFPIIDHRHPSETVILSTSPASPETHWKQFVAASQVEVELTQGCPVLMSLTFTMDVLDRRKYNVSFEILPPDDFEHPENCLCLTAKCLILRQCRNNMISVHH